MPDDKRPGHIYKEDTEISRRYNRLLKKSKATRKANTELREKIKDKKKQIREIDEMKKTGIRYRIS